MAQNRKRTVKDRDLDPTTPVDSIKGKRKVNESAESSKGGKQRSNQVEYVRTGEQSNAEEPIYGDNKSPLLYRSNLVSAVRFFRQYKFTKKHFDCIGRTALADFVTPFMQRKISTHHVRKSAEEVHKILLTYNKDRRRFIIGGKELQIFPIECQLIFGIKCGEVGMHIANPKGCRKPTGGLVARQFRNVKRLNNAELKKAMIRLISGDRDSDIEDVARIIILYLMVNFFFTISGDFVPWSWVKYVEDLDGTKRYNWAREITMYLMNAIEKGTPESVTGCNMLLMYWLAEKTTLTQPMTVDAFPRFRKWNIQTIAEMVESNTLESINKFVR